MKLPQWVVAGGQVAGGQVATWLEIQKKISSLSTGQGNLVNINAITGRTKQDSSTKNQHFG